MADTIKKVGTDGGPTRDYDNWQAWIDDFDEVGDDWVGEGYKDGEFLNTTGFSEFIHFSGLSPAPSASHHIKMTTASGEAWWEGMTAGTDPIRYDTSYGVACRNTGTSTPLIHIQHNYVHILNQMLHQEDNVDNCIWIQGNTNCVVDKCLVFQNVNSATDRAINAWRDGISIISRTYVWTYGTNGGTAISCGCPVEDCCVVFDTDGSAAGTAYARVTGTPKLTNCMAFNFSTAASGTWDNASDYNITDLASGLPGSPGTNNVHSATITNELIDTAGTPTTIDLSIKSGGSAEGGGSRVGSTDVFGDTGTDDIGPMQFVTTGQTLVGSAISSPMTVASGSLDVGGLNLAGSALSSLITVTAGALAAGGANLEGNAIAATPVVQNGSFLPGGLTLEGNAVPAEFSVPIGFFASGAQTLVGNAVASLLSVQNGSFDAVLVIGGGAIPAAIVPVNGSFLAGGAILGGGATPAPLSVQSGLFSAALSLSGNAIPSLFVVQSGEFVAVLVIGGGAIPAPLTVASGSFLAGGATILGGVISALFSIQSGTLALAILAPATPTDLDAEAQAAALALVQEFGVDVTFQTAGGPVLVRVSPPIRHLQRFARRTSVRHGSTQLILPAKDLTFTPTRNMIVNVFGVDSRILDIQPIPSGALIAAYVLFVKMGGQAFTPSSRNTTLDTEMAVAILDVLNELGITAIVVETPVSSYDPLTGVEVLGAATNHSVISTPLLDYEQDYIDGSVIKADDSRVLIRAKDITFRPREGRELMFLSQGEEWRVVTFAMVPTGEQVGLWELQLRQ